MRTYGASEESSEAVEEEDVQRGGLREIRLGRSERTDSTEGISASSEMSD
jgi:hypothetical protein